MRSKNLTDRTIARQILPEEKRIKTPQSRRDILKKLGLAASFAPFLPLLEAEVANAQAAAPKRLILCSYNHGMLRDSWKPTGSGKNFNLNSTMHAAFQPFKNKMIVFDNLFHLRSEGDNHFGGMNTMWTGAGSREFPGGPKEGLSAGISVDQFLVNRLNPTTPFSSLQFGVASRKEMQGNSRNIYAGPITPLAPEREPIKMFDRIFSGANGESPELMALREQRKSVLDKLTKDLNRIRNRVSASDQQKIESHLDAVRSVEIRNNASTSGACDLPERPNIIAPDENDNMPIISPLMIDMMVASLKCDITRFASLQFSVAINNTRFNWLTGDNGQPINEGHHNLSHSPLGTPGFRDYERGTRWYMEQIASLLKRLDETPEGNGTMLDNSLVILGSEVSLGNNHGREPMPYVAFGGLGGSVDTGQFLDLRGETHCRLLTTICHAFGQRDVQQFGLMDNGRGTLPILT